MFAKTIIDSDAFIDMSASAQALYFHLAMRADDDGFVNAPKKIQRMVNASDDDLKILIAKRFLIPFDSGVVVIKHWKIHNYIQGDRYKPTVYTEEKSLLDVKPNKAYTLNVSKMDTGCIQDVSKTETQVRLGKVRIDKVSIEKVREGGAGGTRTTTPKKKKTSVDLFNELENGRLSPVFETVLKWMQYKDESGKPYKTETGMKSFITQVEKHLHEYGAAAVADCIELSMSNNYQGVVWDRLKKQTASNSDSNPFLRMLQESEANDGTGNTEDSISFEGGIPDVLPGFEGW